MTEANDVDHVLPLGEPEQDQEQTQQDTQQEDVQTSLDTDMTAPPNEDTSASQGINLDGANDAHPEHDIPTLETRLPVKKDVALREFMSKMDDYAPIVCSLPL